MFSAIPVNGQTWLICGGRNFADHDLFENAMTDLVHALGIPKKIIHGGASGVDTMADEWAERHALTVTQFTPDWKQHGRAAGPIRNQQMIDEGKPSFVVAFPGGRGTDDMVARARMAKIDVAEIKIKSRKRTGT